MAEGRGIVPHNRGADVRGGIRDARKRSARTDPTRDVARRRRTRRSRKESGPSEPIGGNWGAGFGLSALGFRGGESCVLSCRALSLRKPKAESRKPKLPHPFLSRSPDRIRLRRCVPLAPWSSAARGGGLPRREPPETPVPTPETREEFFVLSTQELFGLLVSLVSSWCLWWWVCPSPVCAGRRDARRGSALAGFHRTGQP